MDQTTWLDAGVVAWVRDHAIALQLDVDTDEAAKAFEIKAMPTIVMMKGDAEVDRIVGARPAAQMLEWLTGLELGKTDLDRARAAVAPDDVMARYQLGQTLLRRGAVDEALEQLIWVWESCLRIDPAYAGVRHSFLVATLGEAARASEKARASIEALRAKAPRGSWDWLSLSEALEDTDGVLEWFDEVKTTRADLDEQRVVVEALRARGRLADYGQLIREPLTKLRKSLAMLDELPAEHREAVVAYARQEIAAMEAGLRAANRMADADALKAEAALRLK